MCVCVFLCVVCLFVLVVCCRSLAVGVGPIGARGTRKLGCGQEEVRQASVRSVEPVLLFGGRCMCVMAWLGKDVHVAAKFT